MYFKIGSLEMYGDMAKDGWGVEKNSYGNFTNVEVFLGWVRVIFTHTKQGDSKVEDNGKEDDLHEESIDGT